MFTGAFDAAQFWDSLSMTFVSGFFLIFVAVIVVYYYAVKPQNQWIVVLVGSLIFCLVGGWQVLAYPVFIGIIVYCAAWVIEATDKKEKKKRKFFVAFSAVTLVAALSVIKLSQFFEWTTVNFIFPIGLSYYTFSAISYVADVYWRKDTAEKNYFKLLAFLIYFPKILQGPISRHRLLAPQMFKGQAFSYKNITFGAQLVLWGFFKKIVLADRLVTVVNTVFANHDNYGGAIIFVTAMLSAVQMYADFSGCMDIAAGISQMLGLELDKNFDHPFFSKTVAEFWRRWHISLGTWFKDYVYMPVAVSPKMIKFTNWIRTHIGKTVSRAISTIIPLAITWILTGLWHGTGMNYIVWGLYWGTLIILSALLSKKLEALSKALHINTESSSYKFFQMARTFSIVCVSRIIVTPGDLAVSGRMLGKIFTDLRPWELVDGYIYSLGLNSYEFNLALICIVILWVVDYLQTKIKIREKIAGWNVVFRSVFYSAAILGVLTFGLWGPAYDAASFVYINF
ncbi:MAG: MBOAT family protein [Oscillospiraceae bacterium]|nr:MBOAT family protein [Oscillospiraceae bacterium]